VDRPRPGPHRLRLLAREPVVPPGRRGAVVPETVLIAIGPWLVPLFWATVILWAAVSAFTLARWWFAERRAAAIASSRRALEDPTADAGVILRGLSVGAAEELAASPRFADKAADRAAAWLLSAHPERVLGRASRGRPWWKRAQALRILARGGHAERVERLEQALGVGPPPLSAVAIALLGRIPDRRAAEILLEALPSGAHPASRIATALETSPATFTDLVAERLRHPSPAVRYWAACLIGEESPDGTASAALADLTCDEDPRIRKAAVRALARIGSGRANAEARRLLDDPVGFVRAHAARALAAADGEGAADRIRTLDRDPDWSVRRALFDVLEARPSAEEPR
jgi:HEAT repeat protein